MTTSHTFDEPSTIAAAQIGDDAAMLHLLDKYDPAIRAAVKLRVSVGHDKHDAEQDVSELFIRLVHRCDLRKHSTLAGLVSRSLRESVARPSAFTISPGTRKRFWAVMRAADYDYSSALALVDAGDAQLSHAAFVAAHQTLLVDSLDAEDPSTGESVGANAAGRLVTAERDRYSAALAALALLDPLQRQVIERRTGLTPIVDARGRKLPPSKITWAAVARELSLSRRDARATYDAGIAALRVVLSEKSAGCATTYMREHRATAAVC